MATDRTAEQKAHDTITEEHPVNFEKSGTLRSSSIPKSRQLNFMSNSDASCNKNPLPLQSLDPGTNELTDTARSALEDHEYQSYQ